MCPPSVPRTSVCATASLGRSDELGVSIPWAQQLLTSLQTHFTNPNNANGRCQEGTMQPSCSPPKWWG